MKKSLLALAVLGAFAGAASAQSSVTLYGRVDLSVAKNAGSADKVIQNGSGSRLGLRGSEDLGGGLAAVFNIEHRFDADTGVQTSKDTASYNATTGKVTVNSGKFWSARSFVGLKGGFGQLVLGREYTTAFLGSQLANDPWGWDTVATWTGTSGITGGGIAKVRNDKSITYNLTAGPVSFGAQVAESQPAAGLVNKPMNLSLGLGMGAFSANLGYEITGEEAAEKAKVLTIGGKAKFGMVGVGLSYTDGTKANGDDVKGYMGTVTADVGAGQIRFAAGQRETADVKDISLIAVGYHHNVSKRTTLYVDVANNSKLNSEKSAYNLGVKHNF
ncbi:MAG: porin [Burkholderiaceae bacterium]|nr:porin [Burkholderiaceae bacterium]